MQPRLWFDYQLLSESSRYSQHLVHAYSPGAADWPHLPLVLPLATSDPQSVLYSVLKSIKNINISWFRGVIYKKKFNVTDEWPSWAISLTWPSVNSMNLFLWVIGSTSRWLWYIANEPKVDKPINAAYLWKFRLRWSLNIDLFSFGKFFHQFRKPLNNKQDLSDHVTSVKISNRWPSLYRPRIIDHSFVRGFIATHMSGGMALFLGEIENSLVLIEFGILTLFAKATLLSWYGFRLDIWWMLLLNWGSRDRLRKLFRNIFWVNKYSKCKRSCCNNQKLQIYYAQHYIAQPQH